MPLFRVCVARAVTPVDTVNIAPFALAIVECASKVVLNVELRRISSGIGEHSACEACRTKSFIGSRTCLPSSLLDSAPETPAPPQTACAWALRPHFSLVLTSSRLCSFLPPVSRTSHAACAARCAVHTWYNARFPGGSCYSGSQQATCSMCRGNLVSRIAYWGGSVCQGKVR